MTACDEQGKGSDRPDPRAPLSGADAAAADRFRDALAGAGSVAVAFSGGVDSSLTAALCVRWLGREQVVAVLGVSPSLARVEQESARQTAAGLGVRLREVATYEMEQEEYVANLGERCYFCKHELYTRAFAEAVATTGSELLVNGDTADDLGRSDRPGSRAATELGVRSPLADAGIGKTGVRRLARALGLRVWDKPAAPCLASRIPIGMPVTRRGLARVERAEAALHALGLRELRVRDRADRAVVQLSGADLDRLAADGLGAEVDAVVRAAGYRRVDLDAAPLVRD